MGTLRRSVDRTTIIRALKERAAEMTRAGRHALASESLSRLCLLEPRDGQVRIRLGHALLLAGRTDDAVGAWKEGIEIFLITADFARCAATCHVILQKRPLDTRAREVLDLCRVRRRYGALTESRVTPLPPIRAEQPKHSAEIELPEMATPVEAGGEYLWEQTEPHRMRRERDPSGPGNDAIPPAL